MVFGERSVMRRPGWWAHGVHATLRSVLRYQEKNKNPNKKAIRSYTWAKSGPKVAQIAGSTCGGPTHSGVGELGRAWGSRLAWKARAPGPSPTHGGHSEPRVEAPGPAPRPRAPGGQDSVRTKAQRPAF